MKRVGILSNALNRGMSGPRIYLENLCRHLYESTEKTNIELVLIHSGSKSNHPLTNKLENIIVSKHPFLRGIELASEDLDLIHYHGYKTLEPLEKYLHSIKSITTIHGAAEQVIPQCFSTKRRLSFKYFWPEITNIFDHVITVTNESKKQLIQHLNIDPEQITTVPNGIDQTFITEKAPPDVDRRDPFILNVNGVSSQSKICRKNIDTLLEAFATYQSEGGKYELHTVGSGWNSEKIQALRSKYGVQEGFVTHGTVSQPRLRELYRSASLYVYPSRYEGFGLSTLEAMVCGCPVVVSEQPNLAEVTGEAGVAYGSPEKTKQLTQVLHHLEQNGDLRASLQKKGFENVCQYSWERCGRETLDVYESILNT